MASTLLRKSQHDVIALTTDAAHVVKLGPTPVVQATLEDAHYHDDN